MKLLQILTFAVSSILVACRVEEVTSLDFFYDTVNRDAFTVVKYYTTWCSHCKGLAPVFRQLSEKFDSAAVNVTFLEVNCELFGSTICRRLPGYPMVEVIKPLIEQHETGVEPEAVETKSWWSRLLTSIKNRAYSPTWEMDLDRVVEFQGSRDLPILTNFVQKVIENTQQEQAIVNVLSDRSCLDDDCVTMKKYLSLVKDTKKEIKKLEKILELNADKQLESIKLKLALLRTLENRDNTIEDKDEL
ncbi:LAME_0F06920g1_1 [Lachancea meyersii CBS 8951]|uniref:LAME_0F06920g1_1 n=1 Tax=Lachancea meyersii CBS 8951 TaxID=1266667 RepID=A0A1G4JU40_9SACH|nr:LAME_0F06920g1_1 [Lachancea meyersii CBS 8951]